MKKILLITLASLVILTSCTKNEKNYTVKETDGVKVFHNTTTPADPNFKITPKEVFTIQGYDENAKDSLKNFIHPHDVAVDSKGNIFVLDSKLSSIKKFDKNGNFVKSIGAKGTGPGEMQHAWQMLLLENKLFVCDIETFQISIFDSEGIFQNRFSLENNPTLVFMRPVEESTFIATRLLWENNEDGVTILLDLLLMNSKFETLKSLVQNKGEFIHGKTKAHDYLNSSCVGMNNIYIADHSSDKYSIDVYDFNGKLKYRIKKDFVRIPFTEEEENGFLKSHRDMSQNNRNDNFVVKYKKAIDAMSMFVTNNGYLLVQVPLERNKENEFDFVVDAFKDGIFINRFKMDIGKGFDYFNSDHKRWIRGNRIYYLNREENCITVYEY